MSDILLFGSLGALGGILFSCVCGGIAAAWRNRNRRNKVDTVNPLPPAPLWTVKKTRRRTTYGNLPPTLPTKHHDN